MSTAPVIPPQLLAVMVRGVSVIVSSRDAAMRPSLMRAVGSLVEDEGREVTVYLSRPQSRQVIQDIAATGHVAVVFSSPSTHLTVQLKARSASMRQAEEGDRPVLAAYLLSMEREIELAGYGRELTRAMLAHKLEELVAVRFTPELAFDQTPGPRAGARLGTER
ncbi:hypothetical protein HHL11_04440 [Ramlibacter sp. G-1-2-2]|uniref:Uncharacterized protein n=1 Tax=Ramlibacter agri TaxID=2728837 RepID=A0A848H5J9_9BURK|nr:hypothetical protein [Ramlibacter agri]NML42988.1 hypothetical protein [Ramlibacter agri]